LLNSNRLGVNSIFLSVEHIKIQELTFLSEYFLITAFFCLALFALFSLKSSSSNKKYFSFKFQYDNQLNFLVILILTFYLVLVYQQIDLSGLTLSSFNDSIINDPLAIFSKFIIGFSSICYLIFVTQYLKNQKLVNFEYYILLLTAIFGFLLLCCTNDLITAYLAIELQGLAFYVLAAFKKSSSFSIESGVKYFILGSFSTALFLLGITFVYGSSGSLLLTDFNDFFIWMFSINSFFVSLESLSKVFANFHLNTGNTESFFITKLHIILDHLGLLKKKAYLVGLDLEFLKSNNAFDISSSKNVSEKMSEIYYNLEFTDYLFQKNSFQLNYLGSMLGTFLIETNFQNCTIELLYNLPESQFLREDFAHLKDELLKVNYYENIGVEPLKLQDNFMSYLNFQKLLEGSSYIYDVYMLLEFSYCSECILNITQFAEYLKVQKEFLTENILNNGFAEVFMQMSYIDKSRAHLDFDVANLFNFQSYIVSIWNILSLNNFFFQFFSMESSIDLVIFDSNFVVLGITIILLALLFKLALAPFHLWSPDVYEGSPTSSTVFFMVLSKLGIFVFLLRVFYFSFSSLIAYWQFYSIVVATTSIFVGAVAGLKQRKLKSLLTYSSINNMGFVLLAFSVGSFEGIQLKFYYLIVYILTSLCLWAIILNLNSPLSSKKQSRELGDLALLNESNNIVAQNFAVILFTMAGLPPMVGFLAKMGVFKALTGVSIYFFSILNILFSVIATFYYLRTIKIIFFENLLIGTLYATIDSKKVFIINVMNFLLGFLFISPVFLYLYSYKVTLFLNKGFY
jgi:proton-translocating NADH-quinone oxidoreductase chain N